jgi:hypothetical protein
MPTLVRLPHWALIVLGASFPGPGLRLPIYLLVAFVPAVTVWIREDFASHGIESTGPGREQRLASATLETLAGFFCATIGLYVMPLFGLGVAILAMCWVVDLSSYRRVDIEFDEANVYVCRGQRRLAFPLTTLRVRRRGSTFVLQGGGKPVEVRFGSARAGQIEDAMRSRGVQVTEQPSVSWGIAIPFLVGFGCALVAVVGLKH